MIQSIAEAIRTRIAPLSFMDKHAGVVRAATFATEDPNVAGRWIRKSFPIACDVTKDECLTGAWRDLVPDTRYKSVSYFEDGGVRYVGKEGNLIQYKASLNWICWLNLPKLGVTDCSISGAIISSVIAAIPDQPFNSGSLTRIRIRPIGELPKTAAIFNKYTYDETLLQYLLGPFDYFCLQFEVDFVIDKRCIDQYTFTDPINCETQDIPDHEDELPIVSFCERVMSCEGIETLVEAVEEIENNYLSCASLANCETFTALEERVGVLEASGSGDMLRSVYDTNNSGVVDNSERLGNQLPAYYGTATDVAQAIADALAANIAAAAAQSTANTALSNAADAQADATQAVADAAAAQSDIDTLNASVGAANGLAQLGADSKLLTSQIPPVLLGAANYQGTWNAATNSPALVSSLGTKGHYYVVSVAGATVLDAVSEWKLGDWVIYNGAAWEKVDNTDAVISVNGLIGPVNLTTTEIPEGTSLYFTVARVLASALTGLSATAGTFTATDDVLFAFGRIKYFIDNIAATILATVLTGISFADATAVTASDSILIAIGKLQKQITDNVAAIATKLNIVGTSTNDNAAAGEIGEVITASVVQSTPVALTTATPADVLSITLTAGDWDISGFIGYRYATSCSVTALFTAVSLTSATLPALDTLGVPTAGEVNIREMQNTVGTVKVTGAREVFSIARYRISISTNTTYYLVARADWTTSTISAFGSLTARRPR